jgi:hypothetical protein
MYGLMSKPLLGFRLEVIAFLVVNLLLVVAKITANGLQLQEVGDFGAQNCLPPLNLIRSAKLQLNTEPPISCRCCYAFALSFII